MHSRKGDSVVTAPLDYDEKSGVQFAGVFVVGTRL
jgi:hypothetical protein